MIENSIDNLKKYGFTPFYESQVTEQDNTIPARVTEVHRELYKIISQFGEGYARIKGSMYNNVESSESFPAVGDFVLIKYNELGDSTITKILDRKSKFSRPDYSGHGVSYVKTILEQVIAANFDYVFIMASLNHDFKINRIQRYLTVAWQSGGIPVVVLTKADLVPDYSQQLRDVQKIAGGAYVAVVSTVSGQGLSELNEYISPSKTLVFLGSSGVGKSSLVNALAGEEVMTVRSIRIDDSKGRHTTTHRQLIMLKSGAMIIDTPGMREIGMWDIGEGLGEAFSDIQELFTKCKFTNCTHKSEPHCAVLEAIKSGKLALNRWNNFLQIEKEVKFTSGKTGYLKEKQQLHKNISKFTKQNKKNSVDSE